MRKRLLSKRKPEAMNRTLYQVDAFASRLFTGNPAAVLLLDTWPDDALMQQIAMENNLSETAFAAEEGEGYRLRWFTPTVEVDFCGHATLATAHVLFVHRKLGREAILFHTRVGELVVSRKEEAYRMDAPADSLEELEVSHEIIEALGEAPRALYQGREDLMAVLESEEQIINLQPDFFALAKATRRGLIATAPGREVDFVSRCFYPNAGIDEDPVTGSAHTTMVPYWAEQLGKTDLQARQLSQRGGSLRCLMGPERVILEGHAVTYLIGELQL